MSSFAKHIPLFLGIILLGSVIPGNAAPPVKKAVKPPMKSSTYAGSPVSATVATANKAELVARVRAVNSQDFWQSRVVSEMMTFNLSEEAWKVLLSDKGVKAAFGAARDINDYAKRVGLGDLENVESANDNAREANQGDVTELLAKLKPLISLTLEATQPEVSPTSASLILRTFSTVPEHMDRGVWKPAGGKANITTILSPVAQDVTITINSDKTAFTITAPSKTEIPGWSTKIEKGLDRGK
ncbi:MAG: hypothetical protein H8F28_27370 [Fibrella sp.]|nr:hypothetical protein [Armatimonadota bacterium]